MLDFCYLVFLMCGYDVLPALQFRFGKGLMMMRVMVFRCLSNRTRLFSIANRLDDCQSDQHNHEYCIIIIIISAAILILESDPHVSSFCNYPSC